MIEKLHLHTVSNMEQVAFHGGMYKLNPRAFFQSYGRIYDKMEKHALFFTAGVGKV
jgi:hypothetical protein